MRADELVFKPVTELGQLLRARKTTPLELTRACLDRIEALDPTLHAFVTVTADAALEEAGRATKEIAAGKLRGPLHGIPYGAKDLLATRNTPTTWGAKPLASQSFDYDAAVVKRLRSAGAILVGKLAMIELAGGLGYTAGNASLTGAARNPWDTSRWTCGSSSGSGSAVGAGLLPFAIGSETWGSIVCPSAFCGISGLRPTFGRVSRMGAMALSWTLDKLGPMARSARDTELVYRAIAGHDPDDPYSADEPLGSESDPVSVKRLKVGYLTMDFKKSGNPDVESEFHHALVALAHAGINIVETKLPDLPFEAAAGAILSAEVSTAFEELERSGHVRELATADARLSFVTARALRGSDLVKAQRVRTVCMRAMADFFSDFDLLLFPTEMVTAFGAEEDFSQIAWADPAGGAGNLCGLPALSVPCGFSEAGLPVGLGIMAGAFEESKALALGRFWQGMTDWHDRRPPIAPAA
jgi:aspartyl-tRNA(Asn)/glutamyl-tRNA(Gln) amidotransferase subunit A